MKSFIIFCYSTAFESSYFSESISALILSNEWNDIIYRSNIRAAEAPVTQLKGERSLSPPIIYVRGRLILDSSSAPRAMTTFDPEDLIDRTFLLDKNKDGTRYRARVKQIAYEL